MAIEREDRTARAPALGVAAALSIGAGVIHAAVIGLHAEHVTLMRLFIAAAVFQIGWGLLALWRPSRLLALVGAGGNLGAFAFWLTTRFAGISFIGGLETKEAVGFTDAACAGLGLAAAVAAAMAVVQRDTVLRSFSLAPVALLATGLSVPAMVVGADHSHSGGHGHDTEASADHHAAGDGHHAAGDDHHDTETAAAAAWPRPYDPDEPLDISGVKGVTAKQERRATDLVEITQRDLPMWADPADAEAAGYRSIGDSDTGFEHYINYGYLGDDTFLDPKKAESLVYQVDGDDRTLVSAMYIAEPDITTPDDPRLEDLGGKLMTWHVHENLCWAGGEDGPKVVGTADRQEDCPPGSVLTGGDRPMVHVWIAPHECGPFAALEGHGAGQTTGNRTDQCDHGHAADGEDGHVESGHGDGHGKSAAVAPKPYDPTQPIDLSGVKGVTPEQQARAENLIAITLIRLPKYVDTEIAYDDGYRSIGDAGTGHEHYINWSYIDDEHELNPDYPESLVYEADPATGERKLVAAMFMLSGGKTLDDVPDIGGRLTQWHIHNNLCFSSDPAEAPEGAPVESVVVGLTDAEGNCSSGHKLSENPMIHVWIVPHKCGPFSALDGVGAGQVKAGDEHTCNHAHGTGT